MDFYFENMIIDKSLKIWSIISYYLFAFVGQQGDATLEKGLFL